jgi:hypothetical protein
LQGEVDVAKAERKRAGSAYRMAAMRAAQNPEDPDKASNAREKKEAYAKARSRVESLTDQLEALK